MTRLRKKPGMHEHRMQEFSDQRRPLWESSQRERVAQLKKQMLSLELTLAREIKEPEERVQALCKLASHHVSLGSDPSPILVEALLSADSVEDELKKGVILIGIAGFFKSNGNDPLPLLSKAVSCIEQAHYCGQVKDVLLIRIGNICMELREYGAAFDVANKISSPGAKEVILTMVQVERAKTFSLD